MTINDIDVSPSIIWDGGVSVDQALGRRWTANITKKGTPPDVGQRVGIYFGVSRIFGGTIQEVTHDPPNVALAYTRYRLACTSWEQRLDSKYVENAVYGQVFYANASTDQLLSQDQGLSNGQSVRLTTTGALPAGLSTGTTYYVRDANINDFKLAATIGGAAINLTDNGTGTHRYIWLARDIASHLVNTFASGEGIDMGAGQIDDGEFLDQIVINWNSGTTVADALDAVAGACNFIWYLGPDLEFNFHARSTTAAPFNISNDKVKSLGFTYRKTRQDYRNKQLIVGAHAGLVPAEETFTGDGTAVRWWLAERAEIIESLTLNGNPATIGVDGVDNGQDFYWNSGERNLRAEVAPGVGASVVIRYRQLGSNVYLVEDGAEQTARAAAEGGTGVYENMVDDTANVDANGSVAKAQAILDANKTIAEEIRYITTQDGLMVGQLQTVAIAAQGILGDYLIDQIGIVALNRSLLQYNVRALGGNHLDDYFDYFKGLKGRSRLATAGSGGAFQGSEPLQTIVDPTSPLITGTDISNHPPVPAPPSLRILLVEWFATLEIAAVGTVTFIYERSDDNGATWATVCTGSFSAGQKYITGSAFTVAHLYRGERTRYSLTAADGTAAVLTLVIKGRYVAL